MFEMGSPEQLVYIENVSDAIAGQAKLRRMESRMDVLQECRKTMEAQHKKILELQNLVANLQNRSEDYASVALSTAKALDHAIASIEKLSGRSVSQEYRVLRTRSYNAEINKCLNERSMTVDPRNTDSMKKRTWYVSGLGQKI